MYSEERVLFNAFVTRSQEIKMELRYLRLRIFEFAVLRSNLRSPLDLRVSEREQRHFQQDQLIFC